MKKMTCRELVGASDHMFEAETFQEMAHLRNNHAIRMFNVGDKADIEAMNEMSKKCPHHASMLVWMSEREAYFNSL